MIEPAGRVGVLRIPRQRSFAQDREPIDRDSLRHGLIAQFGHIAAGIVGAVTGNIDGLAARAKWRAGTKQMMRSILQSWTKRATLPKLLPLRSPGSRLTPTC